MEERNVWGASSMNKEGKSHYPPTVTEEGYFPENFASAHEDTRSC